MRPRLLGLFDQRNRQDAGRPPRRLRHPPAGGGLPPPDPRCPLRGGPRGGVVRSQAAHAATGIGWEGRRQILAVELSARESRSSSGSGKSSPSGPQHEARRHPPFAETDGRDPRRLVIAMPRSPPSRRFAHADRKRDSACAALLGVRHVCWRSVASLQFLGGKRGVRQAEFVISN